LRTPPDGFASGHLLTVTDAAENQFIYDTFSAAIQEITGCSFCDGVWAGFTDELVEGEWRWIDDTPGIWQDPDNFANPIQTAFTAWDKLAPNEVTPGEDYMSYRGNGKWIDYFNAETLPLYIVEFEPVPEPSALTAWLSLALMGVGIGWWSRSVR
jgi:hypothetical protein